MNENIKEHENYIQITKGYKNNMKTSATIFVDRELRKPLFNEIQTNSPYISSLDQLAEVCTLPGLIGNVVGLPDIHTGYGFPIGSVAAFDTNNPESIVSPGGVGYDINCGVRSLKTNLDLEDLKNNQEKLADVLHSLIPTGIGNDKRLKISIPTLNSILDQGMDFLVKNKEIPAEDAVYTENNGFMLGNSKIIPQKAKGKGINQLGSIGSGNHYLEIQYVDEIFDKERADVIGLKKNQIIVMIHTGSRGLGHSICHNALMTMSKDGHVIDGQLTSAPYSSKQSQEYLSAMGSAANYGFVNRSMITMKTREAFKSIFEKAELNVIYDVCHNIAKVENHKVDGITYEAIVHRKGASRAFPPHHKDIPEKYKNIGQPVSVGGSMGTSSYILCGDDASMDLSFGSTCHGAGRVLSRNASKSIFTHEDVVNCLNNQGIVFRCNSKMGMVEEAPGCYKNVDKVVNLSENIGLTKTVCRVKPFIVIKG